MSMMCQNELTNWDREVIVVYSLFKRPEKIVVDDIVCPACGESLYFRSYISGESKPCHLTCPCNKQWAQEATHSEAMYKAKKTIAAWNHQI